MSAKEPFEIPDGMRRVCRRFERWRNGHKARLPIPEALWSAFWLQSINTLPTRWAFAIWDTARRGCSLSIHCDLSASLHDSACR